MSEGHEFLVHISINTGDLPGGEVDELRSAERRRAADLAAQGYLVALWRVRGQWANRGIWRARDRTELDGILASLPLHPYMTIEVDELLEHPSDPRRVRSSASAYSDILSPLPALSVRCRTPEDAAGLRVPSTSLDPLPDLTVVRRDVKAPISRTISTGIATVYRDVSANMIPPNLPISVEAALRVAIEKVEPELVGVPRVVTHSGARGARSALTRRVDAIVIDVGAATPTAAVVTSRDGTRAIVVRDEVRLTLSVPSATVEVAAASLEELCSSLSA